MIFLASTLALAGLAPPPQGPHKDRDHACVTDVGLSDGSRIHYPEDCKTHVPLKGKPLVVLIQGAGYSASHYHDLADHLAGNGYVTLIPDACCTVLERRDDALDALADLSSTWSGYSGLNRTVVFAGHSRGGEAAVLAANTAPSGWKTRGVIALAPTDKHHTSLAASGGRNLLVISGLKDSDVRGEAVDWDQHCGLWTCTAPSGPMRTGFGIYDRSAQAGTYGDRATRAYVAVDNLGHPLQNHNLTKAYAVLWLDWRLNGVDHEDEFFGGAPLYNLDTSKVRLQFHGTGTLLVDDMEGGSIIPKLWDVNGEQDDAWAIQGNSADSVFSSPHDTGVLALDWGPAPAGLWRRYSPSATYTLKTSDLSIYNDLTFRVGQVFDAPTLPGGSLHMLVRITDSAGDQNTVLLEDYVDVRPTTDLILDDPGPYLLFLNYAKSPMQTVRIPLDDFPDVDFGDVSTLSFYLDTDGGEIHLDDIRFVR